MKVLLQKSRVEDYKTRFIQAIGLLLLSPYGFAATFYAPLPGDTLLGTPDQSYYVVTKDDEDLIDLAVKHGIGQNEIVRVNPKVDRWLARAGRKIRIPNTYLLPRTPQKGVVLNLPEFRMYYYPQAGSEWEGLMLTHPISIGRVDWNTPLGKTQITTKIRNPTWTPPASIRREHAAEGDILPAVVPAGINNPLGLFAMRLGVPGYLIHSTNKPLGLGMRVSHGCIRMYPEDIERMFPHIKVGTPVYIVNQPIKLGWSNGALYIEVHPDMEEEKRSYQQRLDAALELINQATQGQMLNISGARLRQALKSKNGIPVAIYQSQQPLRPIAEDVSQPAALPTVLPPSLTVTAPKSVSPVPEENKSLSSPVVETPKLKPPSLPPTIKKREFENSPFPY